MGKKPARVDAAKALGLRSCGGGVPRESEGRTRQDVADWEVEVGDAFASPVECDALICDPPYSDRCQSGHNVAARAGGWREHQYASWTPDQARAFVLLWAPLVRGWMCIQTDHVLGPTIETAMTDAGRYTFAPVACVVPWSRVRMMGDGPGIDWVTMIVSRPRTAEFSRWGCLPGHYYTQLERGLDRVGGKPLALMRAIVRDYTRRGDLVCDPFLGGGTTGVASIQEGRRFYGRELDAAQCERARKRIETAARQTTLWTPGEI